MSVIEKYLSQYAEPEAQQLDGLAGQYQHCFCIPAYNEEPKFIERLVAFINRQSATLAIIVLNRPDETTDNENNDALENHACKKRLTQQLSMSWQHNNLQLHCAENQSAVLLVDRFDAGALIPYKQGVGLARKIAADIALQLIERQQITSPWIYSTDADVVLPDNYFERDHNHLTVKHHQIKKTAHKKDIAAYIIAYQHIATGKPTIDTATQLYQHRLNAYVEGLRSANSPYAFETLGSTLCIHALHYAMVRGFPKRAAGEDFYLLNKLAKTGDILSLNMPVIEIESRISHRTPFGTGSSVDDILSADDPQQAAIFYHPQLFMLLKKTLVWIEGLAEQTASDSIIDSWQDQINNYSQWPAEEQLMITQALNAIDFNRGLSHCLSNSRNATQFKRQMEGWFDGFKTLKYLHALRDKNNLSNISEKNYLALKNINHNLKSSDSSSA